MIPERTERLAGVLLAVGAVVSMGGALLLAVPRYMTEDDAKYVGIGTNLLAGAGPTTVFGLFFPYHAPLWPLIVVLPEAWMGIDPAVWSHALNVLSLLVVVGVAGYLGWRVRPLVGGIAAVAVVGFGYFLALGRGMGLDLPASALTLLYLVVAFDAIERRSLGRAVLAGLLFAAAFLIKEIALSFAPVPFLSAAVTGHAWRPITRCAGATLLAALPGLAWWFALFALETNTVYRLGIPAWTLLPLGIGALIIGISAIGIERIRPVADSGSAIRQGVPAVVGWGLTIAWSVALVAYFAFSRFELGQAFAEPGQLLAHVELRFPEIAPVAGFAFAGIVLLVLCRPAAGALHGLRELVVASIAGFPLVLLVASVGELPRHYVVQSVLLLVVGAAGWAAWLEQILARRAGATALAGIGGAVLGVIALEAALGRGVDGRAAVIAAVAGSAVWTAAAFALRVRLPGPALIVVALFMLFAASSLGYETRRGVQPSSMDEAKATAVARAADWIRANVPVGATVAFGPAMEYETAIAVQKTHEAIRVRELQDVQYDPASPLGIGRRGQPPSDDWILLFEAPARTDILYGYRAGDVEHRLRTGGATVWVLTDVGDASDRGGLAIADILDGAPGIEKVAEWSTPAELSAITTSVLRVDPDTLELDTRPLVVTPAALAFILDRLERLDPSEARPIAARLLERGIVTLGSSGGSGLDDRLRRLAGT